MRVTLARAYDVQDTQIDTCTYRVLVDRLWPRGIRKQSLELSDWNQDIAPSYNLRKVFHAGEMSFNDFASAYRDELSQTTAVTELLTAAREVNARVVELVFAARDRERNHATVLQNVICEEK